MAERDSAREELVYSAERLKRALLGTIQAIAITVEKRDPYTAGHQQKTALLVTAIAEELGWSAEHIEGLRLGPSRNTRSSRPIPWSATTSSRMSSFPGR